MKVSQKIILATIILQSCVCSAMDSTDQQKIDAFVQKQLTPRESITFLSEIDDEFANFFPREQLQLPEKTFKKIQHDASNKLLIIKKQKSESDTKSVTSVNSETIVLKKKKSRPQKKKIQQPQQKESESQAEQQIIPFEQSNEIQQNSIISTQKTPQRKKNVPIPKPDPKPIIYAEQPTITKGSDNVYVNIGTSEIDDEDKNVIEKGKLLLTQFQQGIIKNQKYGPFWCKKEQILFIRKDERETYALPLYYIGQNVIIREDDLMLLEGPFSIDTMKKDVQIVQDLLENNR